MGVQAASVQLRGVILPPQEAQAPPHARGTHVGLPDPYRFGFFIWVLKTASPLPLAAPLGLDSRGSATPFHAQARGAYHSRLDGMVSLLRLPTGFVGHLPTPVSLNSFPMTQYSRFLENSLDSSTGLRLPAGTLFYAPKQNTHDTYGLIFRTLSAPLSLTFSRQLHFPLSLVTP